MPIIDNMPYEASYKKNHIQGTKQFLFLISNMDTWDVNETMAKAKRILFSCSNLIITGQSSSIAGSLTVPEATMGD